MAESLTQKYKEYEARTAANEVGLRALREQVHDLASTIGALAEETRQNIKDQGDQLRESIREQGDQQRDSLKELTTHVRRGQEFKWGPFISAASLFCVIILAILGSWGNGYVRDQNRLESVQEKILLDQSVLSAKCSTYESSLVNVVSELNMRRPSVDSIDAVKTELDFVKDRLEELAPRLNSILTTRWTSEDQASFRTRYETDLRGVFERLAAIETAINKHE